MMGPMFRLSGRGEELDRHADRLQQTFDQAREQAQRRRDFEQIGREMFPELYNNDVSDPATLAR